MAGGAPGLAVRLHTDGGSRGNPGPAAIGVVIERAADGAVLDEISAHIGVTTNNIAEYRALIAGLRRAAELGARRVEVWSDSELMVRQVEGRYAVRHPGLQPLFAEVVRLRRGFEAFRIQHTLRGGNRRADELANRALDAAERPPAVARAAGPALRDVFALAARLAPGSAADLGAGARVARLAPGQERSCRWGLLLRGTVELAGRTLAPGEGWEGPARYRAAGAEDALVLELGAGM